MVKKERMSTRTMVLGALLTAIVAVLQFMGAAIKFGTFSVSLVLIPIVIGAITCGKGIGAWLGFVFGIVVLASGDAAPFWAVNTPGTIITVLLKGTACGFVSGFLYEVLLKTNKKPYPAAIAAALVCPIVNTGVFLIGCLLFFIETVAQWGAGLGFGSDVGRYMLVGLVGANFIFEMVVNIIFAPAIVHIIKVAFRK